MPSTDTAITSVLRVLLIEDDEADVFLVNEILKGGAARSAVPAFEMVTAETLADGLRALETGPVDVVLLDLMLPDSRGMETLRRVVAKANTTPVVVLSNMNDEALSIEAAKNGAQDYLVKGHVESMWLARIMRYAVARKAAIQDLQRQVETLRSAAADARALIGAMDLCRDAVLVLAADGCVRRANAAARLMAGGDLEGAPATDWPHRLGLTLSDTAQIPDDRLPHKACLDSPALVLPVLLRTGEDGTRSQGRLEAAAVPNGSASAAFVAVISRD